MKLIYSLIFIIFTVSIFSCGEDPVQEETGSIEGVVYDFESGEFIGLANISTIPPSSAVTSSSQNGSFKILHVDPGMYRVQAKKNGYDSSGVNISILAGEKTVADIVLLPDTTVIDTTQIF